MFMAHMGIITETATAVSEHISEHIGEHIKRDKTTPAQGFSAARQCDAGVY